MPIFRVKSVKIYTGQKKFTRIYPWDPWQIWGMDNGSVVVDHDVGDGGIVVDDDNDSLNSLHLDVSSKDDPASLELTGIIFQLWNERATRWKG